MKKILGPVIALAAAFALTSCNDDSAGGGNDSITVAFIGSTESQVYSFPEASDAARARFEAVNAAGGVNGRRINFVSCNDKADPNEAAACARKAAQDRAVAVIGGISAAGDPLISALQSAKIAYTGNRPLSPGELNSSIAFPLVGGSSATAGGAGLYAVQKQKCTSIYVIDGDVPGNRATAKAFKAGALQASGKEPKETVTPATTSDYGPAAAAAAAVKADCVYFAISVPEMPKAIPTFRRALPDATIMTSAGNLPEPIIKALGAHADGIVLADSQLPVTTGGNAYIEQFREQMKQHAPDATVDPFALSSWMGADLLVQTLQGMSGTIDAAAVLKAYGGLGAVDGHGVIGNFTFGDRSPVAGQARMFNRKYIVYHLEGGKPVVTDPTFADATPALERL